MNNETSVFLINLSWALAIILVLLGITFAILSSEIHRNPYDNCLAKCSHQLNDDSLTEKCIENCNEVFKQVTLDFFNKTQEVIVKYVNGVNKK